MDGEKVFVDGGYPFAHTLEVPLRKDQATLRLRIIARDTGGNEAYWPGPGSTNEHTLTIADDLVPPQVLTYFPRENSTVLPGETVVAVFNERMAPESIHVRSIRLDRVNENNTTTPIELASVVYDDATQSAYAKLPAILPPANYRLYVNELATDLPSNPLKLRPLFVIYLARVRFMVNFGSIETTTLSRIQEKKSLKNGLLFLIIITTVSSILASLMRLPTLQETTPLRISTLVDIPFRRYCHTVGLKHSRKDKTLVQMNNLPMWVGLVKAIKQ